MTVLLANEATRATALRWLVVDALAPVLGAVFAIFLTIEGPLLGAILGLFVGFFLYVGAAELLPEAHRKERGGIVVVATVAGAAFIYTVTHALESSRQARSNTTSASRKRAMWTAASARRSKSSPRQAAGLAMRAASARAISLDR